MALPSKELPEQALDALIARERTRIVAPLTEWRTLSLQLRDEGLIRPVAGTGYEAPYRERTYTPPPSVERRPGWRPAAMRWTARVAGMAALFAGGMLVGRGMTLGQQVVDTIRVAMTDSTSSGGTVRVKGTKGYASVSAAQRALVQSQAEYERAAAFLAASDTSPRVVGDPNTYRERLAGLDEMATAAQNALRSAPDDPLLNQYYLSAIAAREATLDRLDHTLPQGVTVVRY